MKKIKNPKTIHKVCTTVCISIIIIFIVLVLAGSPYLDWDYSNKTVFIIGTAMHIFEFTFVRLAPFLLAGGIAGILMTRKHINKNPDIS